ncbi:MAG TPA: PBP1A family penicillin-binding protein [Candidatus Saccharimonadales bacterium]
MNIVQKKWRAFRRLPLKNKILLISLVAVLVLFIIAVVTTVIFANTLSSKARIMNRNNTGVTLLDRNGQVFYQFYAARADTHVPLSEIAPVARQAIISAEDKGFYEHAGFSIQGIANAVWQNIKPGGLDSGGSTITQQLVKNALLSQDRNLLRKYQELVLSIEIERRYSKDEILEMYLNSVHFGEGVFGIEDAAQTYFGKHAKELTLAEASMLAGIIPAPSIYSPISGDATKAKQRQTYVLRRMQEDGVITTAQKDEALAAALTYAPVKPASAAKAPHFAEMVRLELIKKYGEETVARSGYKVKTTLNLDYQQKAEAAVAAQVDRLSRSSVSNGSVVIEDPKTGEVLAVVGSRDWNNEQFGKVNIATSSRQPGSSFKPLVYATGIEEKTLSAATILHDKKTDFGGGYSPNNYDLRFRGDVTVRRALANSLNIPAVEAMQRVGIRDVIAQAKEMGITTLTESPEFYGLPLALGAGQAKLTEMTNAYAAFANQGSLPEQHLVLSIDDKYDDRVFTAQTKTSQAISSQTAFIMSSMLSDNSARSETFGSSLTLSGGRLGAVKTGTTEDYRDAWTIGYTPSLVIGVWIGNNDNTPMSRVAGSSGSAPIWRNLMNQLLTNTPKEPFIEAAGLFTRNICYGSGALADTKGTNTYSEYFRSGTLPTKTCNQPQPKKEVTPVTPPKEEESSNEEENDQTPDTGNDTDNNENSEGENTDSNQNSGNGGGNGATTPVTPPITIP